MTHFVAYVPNDLFEEFDSKEEAIEACDNYLTFQGGNAGQGYVLEINSSDLVEAAWEHVEGDKIEETTEWVGDDVDSLS